MKRTILEIILEDTFGRLPLVTRHKDYVFQTIKAIEIKHHSMFNDDSKKFLIPFELANEAWLNAQKHFIDNGKEFSNVLFIKFMLEDYDWMMEHFKLKQKRLDKLYDSYDLSKHILRTKQVYNEVIKQIDISIAQYNYRNK